jgi:hypothetical protein
MKRRFRVTLLLLLIGLMLLPVLAGAADVSPADEQRWDSHAYTWVLAANQTTSGDSGRAVNVQYCKSGKTLEIKTSGGTVDITCAFKEDGNAAVTKSVTLTAAGTTKYSAFHPMTSFYVTSTITAGTIDSIILRCN